MELNYDYLHSLRGGVKVRLPSDNLSQAALRKRSGPCRVYQLGKPMGASEFRRLPRDLRRAYLQRLRARGGTPEAVGRMLGLTPEATARLLQQYRITLDQPDSAAWTRFLQR